MPEASEQDCPPVAQIHRRDRIALEQGIRHNGGEHRKRETILTFVGCSQFRVRRETERALLEELAHEWVWNDLDGYVLVVHYVGAHRCARHFTDRQRSQ